MKVRIVSGAAVLAEVDFVDAELCTQIQQDAGFADARVHPEDLKALALDLIKQNHAEALRLLSSNVSVEERDTWTEQKELARAFKAGTIDDNQRAVLQSMCKTGETVEQLAEKILKLVAVNHRLMGLANGIKRRAEQRLEQGDDPDLVLQDTKNESEAANAEFLASLQQ